jgi:hypothetical protein
MAQEGRVAVANPQRFRAFDLAIAREQACARSAQPTARIARSGLPRERAARESVLNGATSELEARLRRRGRPACERHNHETPARPSDRPTAEASRTSRCYEGVLQSDARAVRGDQRDGQRASGGGSGRLWDELDWLVRHAPCPTCRARDGARARTAPLPKARRGVGPAGARGNASPLGQHNRSAASWVSRRARLCGDGRHEAPLRRDQRHQ